MRITRLASLFAYKYKIASTPGPGGMIALGEDDDKEKIADRLEAAIKDNKEGIGMLWNYATNPKLYNILHVIATKPPEGGEGSTRKIAVAGHKFVRSLLEQIDVLNNKAKTMNPAEIVARLVKISNLISENEHFIGPTPKEGEPIVNKDQFSHVIEYLYQTQPGGTLAERNFRDKKLYPNARTGLSRIKSKTDTLLKELAKLKSLAPERFDENIDLSEKYNPDRIIPQRGMLSSYDIDWFLRNHGQEYGIKDRDDWEFIFGNDPILKETMITVINALKRGHSPAAASYIKRQIATILENKNQPTNEAYLEQGESVAPSTSTSISGQRTSIFDPMLQNIYETGTPRKI